MTKEEIIEKHLKAYLEKIDKKYRFKNLAKQSVKTQWLLNAMDEYAQQEVNKKLQKPAVMQLDCDCKINHLSIIKKGGGFICSFCKREKKTA